ncbi:hypothetical protein Bca4012_068571 [Brassica carinata]
MCKHTGEIVHFRQGKISQNPKVSHQFCLKSLEAQFIDMKIAGNISGNLEACNGEMTSRVALPEDEQNDNKTKINQKKNGD